MWLSKKEYVPYAPEEEGTISIHHCKDGKDNDKLFITRCENGHILAFCHHCGKRGFADTSDMANISTLKARKAAGRFAGGKHGSREYKLPDDCINTPEAWPNAAKVWGRRHVTDEELRHNGIAYSPSHARVIIPVYDDGGLALYQTRKLFKEDSGPKYKTYRNRPAMWRSSTSHTKKAVVICEDVLSGIKVGRLLPSVALLGTSISDESLNALTTMHNEFIMFLDDDNADVRMKQLVLKNRLEIFGDVRIIHSNGRDAKEHSESELRGILL